MRSSRPSARAGWARCTGLRRFTLEAQSTGALSHPNIFVVYDVGTDQGIPYVVSELLEGRTLRDALGSGALPARKAAEARARCGPCPSPAWSASSIARRSA
jgi:serine/threonine protein kinase